MNFTDTKKKISLKTLAVIQVHCFGIVSEIEKVKIYLIKKDTISYRIMTCQQIS